MKNKPFYTILERMNEAGLETSISVSLQSLYAPALELMDRKNMNSLSLQQFFEVTSKNNIELYGELMWGLPGETYQSFIQGYDTLSKDVPRIAIYPHLLLPNTTYNEKREELNFKTLKVGKDDFEYIISHSTMSFEENQRMQRFIFWARILFEYPFFRHIMHPLRKIAFISQSQVILSFDQWLDDNDSYVAEELRLYRSKAVNTLDAYNIEHVLPYLYQEPDIAVQIEEWWKARILPYVPVEYRALFVELVRYDLFTKPILGSTRKERENMPVDTMLDGYQTVTWGNESYYVRELDIAFNIPEIVRTISNGSSYSLAPNPKRETLFFKVGFADYISNHEFYYDFCGKTELELTKTINHPPTL